MLCSNFNLVLHHSKAVQVLLVQWSESDLACLGPRAQAHSQQGDLFGLKFKELLSLPESLD